MSKSKYRRIKQNKSGRDSKETRKHPTPSAKNDISNDWLISSLDRCPSLTPNHYLTYITLRQTPSHLSMECIPFFFYFEKRARRFFQRQQKHTKKHILKMLISFSWLKSSYLFSGLTTKENFNFLSSWWIQVDYSQYSFLFIRWHDFKAKIHNQAVFKWHFFKKPQCVK